MLMALESVMNQGIFYFNCWVVVDFFFVSPSVYISFSLARIVRDDRVNPILSPHLEKQGTLFLSGPLRLNSQLSGMGGKTEATPVIPLA